MNLLLNASSTATGEQAVQQIESALASINYPNRAKSQEREDLIPEPPIDEDGNPGYRFQDPFDKVLLTKGIDNQILTSFRTLTKANNVVSDTLKIVHTKFSPTPMSAMQSSKLKKAYGQKLYVINEEVFNHIPEENSPL